MIRKKFIMSTLHELIKTKNFSGLTSFAKSNTNKGVLPRIINLFLECKEIDYISQLIDLNVFDPVSNKILSTRYYLETGDVESAVNLLTVSVPERKRQVILVVEHLVSTNLQERAWEIYKKYSLALYPVDSNDLELFGYNHNLLENIVGKPIFAPTSILDKETVCFGAGAGAGTGSGAGSASVFKESFIPKINDTRLKKIGFTETEIDTILDSLSSKIPRKIYASYKKQFSGYEYVIDGANVLFSGKGKINLESYQRLDSVIKRIEQCTNKYLIVLHERHFKYTGRDRAKITRICNSWKDGNICSTPKKLNDDWFAIMAAMMCYPCYIVTNDQFRDHVYYVSDKLKHWKLDYGVGYEFVGRMECKLAYPSSYSRVIQVSEEGTEYYVPVDNSDTWIVV